MFKVEIEDDSDELYIDFKEVFSAKLKFNKKLKTIPRRYDLVFDIL